MDADEETAWASMPLLDVRKLSTDRLNTLASHYDSLAVQTLQPLGQLNSDPVRAQIDRAVTEAIGIPDIAFIRELLEREPGLNAEDISPRAPQKELGLRSDEDEKEATQSALF